MEIVVSEGRALATDVYNLGDRFALVVASKASSSRREAKAEGRFGLVVESKAGSCRRAAEGEARRFGLVVAHKETSIGSSFEATLKARLKTGLEASAKALRVEGGLGSHGLTSKVEG